MDPPTRFVITLTARISPPLPTSLPDHPLVLLRARRELFRPFASPDYGGMKRRALTTTAERMRTREREDRTINARARKAHDAIRKSGSLELNAENARDGLSVRGGGKGEHITPEKFCLRAECISRGNIKAGGSMVPIIFVPSSACAFSPRECSA